MAQLASCTLPSICLGPAVLQGPKPGLPPAHGSLVTLQNSLPSLRPTLLPPLSGAAGLHAGCGAGAGRQDACAGVAAGALHETKLSSPSSADCALHACMAAACTCLLSAWCGPSLVCAAQFAGRHQLDDVQGGAAHPGRKACRAGACPGSTPHALAAAAWI